MPMVLAQAPGTGPAKQTTRVSVASNGAQANQASYSADISADGRFVAFESTASNLVSGDTNAATDVFVHDRQTGRTTRVSVASDGSQANGPSSTAVISADGRFVAFLSGASNLVSGDTNDTQDVFVHDRQTRQTTRVSVASDGAQADDVDGSWSPAISANGRFVAFLSAADNLVPGDTNNGVDLFMHDQQTGQTTRVSVVSEAGEALSGDGRFIALSSWADNLVPGDTNRSQDVFVHDRQTGQTTRVSVASNGAQADDSSWSGREALSGDGRFVAFTSWADNLVPGDTNRSQDVFVHDRQTGQTTRVSVASNGAQANRHSYAAAISGDGRFVTFTSLADNLVSGDTNGTWDVFVHDRQTGQTTRVSVASDGSQANALAEVPAISADGRFVAFESDATNLVRGDTNGYRDIFVHDRGGGTP